MLGEDVLITGAGPIGLMAAAVVRHAGARHVVVTDVNAYRLALAATDGRDASRSTCASSRSPTSSSELGHAGGLRRRPRDVGRAGALREMIANMAHGGRIAMLGIPTEEIAIDLNAVVFNMITLKGIYGREMYETWYQMTVMLQSGLDISPVITHRFCGDRVRRGVRDGGERRAPGKVILDWERL